MPTRPNAAVVCIFSALLLNLVSIHSATANPKEVERIRKFYKQHNLDFFGDLIADQTSVLEDEKRHAKIELLADDARTKAMEQLEKLLKNADSNMRAELLIRKATLFADRARTATYFQNNTFKASKLQAPSVYLNQSIKTFMQIESGYPKHPRMDVVLFSIAYNYGELKNVDQAFTYYTRMVKGHPESPLVGDARLAIAEILFDKRKFADCLAQLKEIVKSDHPRLKNFALYKMAWTYYNMADLDSGILSLEKVIDGVNAQGAQAARIELRKEALNDLVLFFSEGRKATDATSYFETVAKTPDLVAQGYEAIRQKRLASLKEKNAPIPDEEQPAFRLKESQELLLRLTNIYREQGKHENSMIVSEQLISSLGKHPKTPPLYRLRAEAAEKMRRRDLVLVELERLAKVAEQDLEPVSATKSGLPEHSTDNIAEYFKGLYEKLIHGNEKKLKAPERKLAEYTKKEISDFGVGEKREFYRAELHKQTFETFKDFSNFMHGEWLKTQNADASKMALSVYDLSLRVLIDPWRGHPLDACFELKARRAQLHFAMHNWDKAAQDFEWLAQHVTGTAQLDALKGHVASLEELIKQSPIKITKGDLNPTHRRLEQAYDRFLAFKLEDEKLVENISNILSASARLYKEYGKTSDALERMVYYSRTLAKQKDAVALTRDVLATLEQGSRWEELRDYSDTLNEIGAYKSTPADKEIRHSYEYASLRLLEQLEKDKDWKKASKEFTKFAEKNPNSVFISQALLKAANAAIELKDTELAIERLESATKATDGAVQLQAWLTLEPFYRKGYQFKKLLTDYQAILKLKIDSKVKADTERNLKSIQSLAPSLFQKEGDALVAPDKDVEILLAAMDRFERSTKDFKDLRFKKSNNNPNQNFKKKADMHAALTKSLEKTVDQAPKSLRGAAAVWGDIQKAELLYEFADTIEQAALPAVLTQATEADRKAYVETLAGQVKELRDGAKNVVIDGIELAPQVDSPLLLEARLNVLAERIQDPRRLSRAKFSEVWAKRPGAGSKHDADVKDKDVNEAGVSILTAEKKDDVRAKMLKLAEIYYKGSQPGYAYAVANAVVSGGSDEYGEKSQRLIFNIDAERLPSRLVANPDGTDPKARWDLARWINANKKLDSEWADKAIAALLRSVSTGGKK